jgi:hypothetical protein
MNPVFSSPLELMAIGAVVLAIYELFGLAFYFV